MEAYETSPLLMVRSRAEPESDLSAMGSFEEPTWRHLPGYGHATVATDVTTPPRLVTGSLYLNPSQPPPEDRGIGKGFPAINAMSSALAESKSFSSREHANGFPKHNASSFTPRQDTVDDNRSLSCIGESRGLERTPVTLNEDNQISLKRQPFLLCMCSPKTQAVVVVVMIIIFLLLVITVVMFVVLPADIHSSAEVYNVNNDTVLAVQFDRTRYNTVKIKHVRRDFVERHTIYVYSSKCRSVRTENRRESHKSGHPLNITQHSLVSSPVYLLPGSVLQFNITVLQVHSIAEDIYLYIFNDLDLLHTYYFEENMKKRVFKSKVYTKGSGSQESTTKIGYNVTQRGYWFAAILCDNSITFEYSIVFHKILYDESKLTAKCTLQDTDSCSIDLEYAFASQCILCSATAPTVSFLDPAYVTTTVGRDGNSPAFVIALVVLVVFCPISIFTCIIFAISRFCKRT